jgi:hypothetical protein
MRKSFWCGMGLTLAVAAGFYGMADLAYRCPNSKAGQLAEYLFGCFRSSGAFHVVRMTGKLEDPGTKPRIIDLQPDSLSRALDLIDVDQLSQYRLEGIEPPLEQCEIPSEPAIPLDPPPAAEEILHAGMGEGRGVGGAVFPQFMPLCGDEEEDYPATMPYADEDEAKGNFLFDLAKDNSLFDFWMGLFSGPVLDSGAAEESEPSTIHFEEPPPCPDGPACPSKCPGCPSKAVCPWSGPAGTLEAGAEPKGKTQEKAPAAPREPKTGAKPVPSRRIPVLRDERDNEECPIHPEVDTMEARKGEFENFRPDRPN